MTRPLPKSLIVSALVLGAAAGGLFLMRVDRSRGFARASSAASVRREQAGLLQAAREMKADAAAEAPPDPLAAMDAGRRLVRNATLSLEVARYADAATRAEAVAAAEGGYLAGAQVAREAGDHDRGTLTLRVRADRFDAALHALKALGRIDNASVDTQDIGREYMDLETRLSAERDTEARLRELLRSRTARLSDVLAAEKELSRVIEQREALEGERRYFDRQLALSTITVDLHEPPALLRDNALSPLREALGRALPLLSASVAALVCGIAAALPWMLLGFALWKLHRRFAVRRLIRVATER